MIGGGPAALLASLCLKQRNGITSTIYEIRPSASTLGGAIGIPANGLQLLQSLGLYEEFAAKGALVSEMQIHASNGRKIGEVDITSWTKARTGFGYLRIQRTAMMNILLENASKVGISVMYGKQVTEIEESEDNVTARFADGTTDTGDFLLGCDGIHSAVRSLYVDPDVVPEYSGIANMYSLVPVSALAEKPREPLTALHTTLTSNGLFAITPATRERDWIYWFFSREVAAPSTPESRDGWKSTLR